MARGKIDTSDGMVADFEEMLDFVQSAKQMIDELTETRNEVNEAMVKMGDLGNTDDKCHEFVKGFNDHSTKIDDLNEILNKTSKFYTELADKVREETETDIHVNRSYRR